MRTGIKLASLLIVGVLWLPGLNATDASSRHPRKPKKQELAPLPSGPLGPVPQLPLDSTPAVAPQVSYRSGQLTILAPNSSLGDILRAVRKQTGAEMEIPPNTNERVVTQLGPGPAREVIAELLNGSRFNYVLLGSPADPSGLTRVLLVAKTADAPGQNGQPQQQPPDQAGITSAPLQPDTANAQPDTADAEAADDNAGEENNAEQNAAEADQPPANPDQPGVKTPQQMLQEMQQRQLQVQQQQLQQQQQQQPPIPGVGYPPPPQRPQPQQQ